MLSSNVNTTIISVYFKFGFETPIFVATCRCEYPSLMRAIICPHIPSRRSLAILCRPRSMCQDRQEITLETYIANYFTKIMCETISDVISHVKIAKVTILLEKIHFSQNFAKSCNWTHSFGTHCR